MNFDNKDLLKFAFELYKKTKDKGLVSNWGIDGLESLIEAASQYNFTGLIHTQPNKGGKIKQETGADQSRNHRHPISLM